VRALLANLGVDSEKAERLLSSNLVGSLRRNAWPGNVRELRNYLERFLLLQDVFDLGAAPAAEAGAEQTDLSTLPYADARARALADFERAYVEEVLRRHEGNVSRAADAAGVARVHLYRLLHKHGLR